VAWTLVNGLCISFGLARSTQAMGRRITKSAARWCDIIDETEVDPLLNLENWKVKELPSVHVRRTPNDERMRIEGRALREAPHIRRDSNAQTESPLLTAPSDEPLGVVWVSCDSEGVGMGVDRGDRVKPLGYVCVGGLDANDLDETEDYIDGGMASGYVDDRTGLILDEALTRQAEAEEMDFMQKIQLYDVVESAECWERAGNPPRHDQVG